MRTCCTTRLLHFQPARKTGLYTRNSSTERATPCPGASRHGGRARGRRKLGSVSECSSSVGKGVISLAFGGAELLSPQHQRAPALLIHHGTTSPVPPGEPLPPHQPPPPSPASRASGSRGGSVLRGVAAELQPDARPPPAAAQLRSPLGSRQVTNGVQGRRGCARCRRCNFYRVFF